MRVFVLILHSTGPGFSVAGALRVHVDAISPSILLHNIAPGPLLVSSEELEQSSKE